MKWFLLGAAEEAGFYSVEGSLGEFDEYAFRRGQPVTGFSGGWLRASPETDGRPDDLLVNHYSLPIWSKRMQHALSSVLTAQCVEYLPIRVIHADGHQAPGYAIANILGVVEAFDLEHSSFEVFDEEYFLRERRGKIRSMNAPVLRGAAIEGRHLIRPAGFAVHVYCSQVFRRIVEENNLTGAHFYEVPVV